ncbi:hypothetical protein F5890DRAFT_235012 [Lentinula detonsa]|uniref:Extracellular membrane protein CFEM domain-containing protein n=1 Tax=Lentinula detonsa TaxID=2804962 RepID=A0AA38UQW5_9AGAR|nr:hypothetical protein F5890DRAFT_235012 [Lentinula detonsa]
MKFPIFYILGLSLYVGLAVAQVLSQCATACVSQAAVKDGCVSFAQFQQDALSCLTAECSSSDLTTLEGLQAQECGAMQLSATGTPSDTATFTASGISSGSGTSLSIPSTSGATSATVSGSGSASTSSGSGTIVPPPSSVISSATSAASSAASSASSPSTTGNNAQNVQIPLGMGMSFVALFAALWV